MLFCHMRLCHYLGTNISVMSTFQADPLTMRSVANPEASHYGLLNKLRKSLPSIVSTSNNPVSIYRASRGVESGVIILVLF